MQVAEIIRRKRDGYELTPDEIDFLIKRLVAGEVSDAQAAAFLMAAFCRGLNREETAALTRSMAYSGEVLDLGEIPGIKVDLPSTGGVGNKTPLIVPPMVAAAGVYVPKMSGRSLKHTGGTIDILESIGYKAEISIDQFISNVKQIGLSNICQTVELTPADRKLYKLRKETGTVESIPLIVSSIISKKIAIGCDVIVIDVKAGAGALLTDYNDALELAQELVRIGELTGIKTIAVITDNSQPQGRAVGNSLAIAEAVDVLKGEGPEDQQTLCLELAAHMLILAQKAKDMEEARSLLKTLIAEGKAFEKFKEQVRLHGGDVEKLDDPERLRAAKFKIPVTAPQDGYVSRLDADEVNTCARRLIFEKGTDGREKIKHYDTGIVFNKKLGDAVSAGEEIAVIHANDKASGEKVRKELLKKAYEFSEEEPVRPPLIHAVVTKSGIQVQREITAIIAFIKARLDGEDKYLLQYNKHWNWYNLISGKEEAEDKGELKNTALREVSEELFLEENEEFTVKELPIEEIELVQFSKRHKVYTRYKFKLYQVFFIKPFERIISWLKVNHNNKWFTEEEIRAGRGRDGSIISETARKVINQISGGLSSLPYSFEPW